MGKSKELDENKQEKRLTILNNLCKIALVIAAIGYVFALLKIVLFKYGFASDLRSVNLIPFSFVTLFWNGLGLSVTLKNVLGNIAIFIPLGVFVAGWGKKKPGITILFCACVSLCFELIQLITASGACDVDDLILNTLGAAIGVGIYHGLLNKLDTRANMPIASTIFFLLFGIAGLLSLYMFQPSMLPTQIEFVNEEVFGTVDKGSYTLNGKCVALKDGIVSLEKNSAEWNHENEGDIVTEAATDTTNATEEQGQLQSEYTLSDDAILIMQTMSYQYSPNGNIQKTTVTYEKVDQEKLVEAIETQEGGFTDLWINSEGQCNMLVLTVWEDKE